MMTALLVFVVLQTACNKDSTAKNLAPIPIGQQGVNTTHGTTHGANTLTARRNVQATPAIPIPLDPPPPLTHPTARTLSTRSPS